MSNQRLFILISGTVALGLALGLSYRYFVQPGEDLRPAPEFSIVAIDGKAQTLPNPSTPLTVVNVWASWCEPCAQELPSLLRMVETMRGKVQVLALSQDSDEVKMRAFLKRFEPLPAGFSVIADRGGKIRQRFDVQKLPESFIINSDNRIIRKIEGYDDWSTAGAIAYLRLLTD